MKLKNIDDLNPFIDYTEDNILLGRNGELCAGFRITLSPIFTESILYFEELFQMFTTVLTSFPSYYRLHKQDFFSFEKIDLPVNDYIEKQRAKLFSEQKILKQESFIYLCAIPPGLHDASLLIHSPFSYKRDHKAIESAIQAFKESVFSFESLLTTTLKKQKEQKHFFIKRLSVEDFLGIPSPECFGVMAKYLYLNNDSYSDIILNKNAHELKVGDNFVDILSVSDLDNLPLSINPVRYYNAYSTDDTRLHLSMMARLGAFLTFPHVLNTIIAKGNTELEKKKLETKSNILSNFSATSRDNRLAGTDIDDFLENQAVEGGEILDCHFNVILWDKDRELLFRKKTEVENTFKSLNFIPKHETIIKATLFFACLPGNEANVLKEMRFKTTTPIAASFLNMDDLQENDSKAKLQVCDRFSGRPINIDISDVPLQAGWIDNLNKLVIGSSGGGKSVTMNYYTMSNYRNGAHIIIIDQGASYEGICNVFDGLWFEFTDEQSVTFNPFVLYDFDRVNGKLTLLKSTALLSLIKLLWKGSNGVFSEVETTTIEKMIDAYYFSDPADYCFNSFYEFVLDNTKFQINPEINFPLTEFKYVLEPYYKGGKYELLLNATKTLNLLEERLIIFETGKIKDSKLFPAIACLIMDTISVKLSNLPGVRKQILQDEAWKALANPQLEPYFLELAKTVRKQNGELIFVTQEIDDLISSTIIKNAIINNTGTKIILSQNQFQKRFDDIQAVLGLTEHEKALTFSLNKAKTDNSKDILVSFSNGPAAVYTIRLTLAEYLICTSRQEEKAAIRLIAEHFHKSYYDAIKLIVEHLSPRIDELRKNAELKGEKINYYQAVQILLQTNSI